jgi:myo-inositol-1(or 4)-monophosphatase
MALGGSDLLEIQSTLISLALSGGEIILSADLSSSSTETKKNCMLAIPLMPLYSNCISAVDLVTEYDKKVEAFISTSLQEKYPNLAFMGEETYKPGTRLSNEPTFIVDPIDGTTNFVHGNPFVAISLGFSIDRRPVVGVVYAPHLRKLWTAVKGHGAVVYNSINSLPNTGSFEDTESKTQKLGSITPLPFREPTELTLPNALVAVEWGSDRTANDFKVKSNTFAALALGESEGGAMVHALRSYGSAALNLCHVASRQLDAYWEAGCWAWDVCAGWCILSESGGVMVGANPGEWEGVMDLRRYLAVRGDSSKLLDKQEGVESMTEGQKKFISEFWKHVKGEFEVGPDSTS